MTSQQDALAARTINPDDVATAAWVILNADATLQGASYLGASDRVWKWSSSVDPDLPALVVAASHVGEVDGEGGIHGFFVDALVVCENPGDGARPDASRMRTILDRVSQLLVGRGKMTATGIRFFDCEVDTMGPAGEGQAQGESEQLARFYVTAVKT